MNGGVAVWARRAALMAGTNTWQDRSLHVLAGHTCFRTHSVLQAGSVSFVLFFVNAMQVHAWRDVL